MLGASELAATIPAVDLQRALEFYTEVLGLRVVESNEGAGLLEAGSGTKIFMYRREATKAEHTAITFYVDDLDAVVDGLINKGVVFEQYDFGERKTDERGIIDAGDARAAWLTDTEGNIIAITSR